MIHPPGSAAAVRRARLAEIVRRVADVVVTVVLLVLVAVPMLTVALLVRLDSTGPALFRQERVGLDRRPFTLYKFRTMRLGGDDARLRRLIEQELRGEARPVDGSHKLADDDRVTRVGRVLRALSLDELPQLFNVLRGQMTLVGPRPCLPWEADLFPAEYQDRFRVRPGLTGLWQVSGRSALDTLDMLRLDVRYVASRTLWSDLRILLATVPALLRDGSAR